MSLIDSVHIHVPESGNIFATVMYEDGSNMLRVVTTPVEQLSITTGPRCVIDGEEIAVDDDPRYAREGCIVRRRYSYSADFEARTITFYY